MVDARLPQNSLFLAKFFGRAWQFRLLTTLVAATSLLTLLAASITDSLQLSPIQRADSILGNSDSRIQIPGSAILGVDETGVDQGLSDAIRAAGGVNVKIEYIASGVQDSNNAESSYILRQLDDPSNESNLLQLISGRWPKALGEATVSSLAARSWPVGSTVRFFSSNLTVRVVGIFNNRFAKNSHEFVLANGTWSSLSQIPTDVATRLGISANRIVYWSGEAHNSAILDAVKKTVQTYDLPGLGAQSASNLYLESRAEIESTPPAVNLPLQIAMFACPLIGGLLGGLIAGLFLARIRETMWTVGISLPQSRKSANLAILGSSIIGGGLGSLLGTGVGFFVRPVLAMIDNQELGPVTSTPLVLLVIPASIFGAFLGMFIARNRVERSDQTQATPIWDRILYRIVIAVVFISGGMFFGTGASEASRVSLAALLIATAVVILIAPVSVQFLGLIAPKSFALRLAFRRFSANQRASNATVSSIAVLLILGFTVAIFVSSSLAYLNDSTEAQVPPGQIVLTPQSDDSRQVAKIRAEVEVKLGLGQPILVYTAGAGSEREDGATRVVPSVEALEQITEVALDATQKALLESGGTLVTKPLKGDLVSFPKTDSFAGVTLQAGELDGLDASFRNIDGFILKKTAQTKGFPLLQPQYVYTGVTVSQSEAVKQVTVDLSLNSAWIQVHRAPDTWGAPLQISVISLMLSLIASSIILLAAISDSRRLRPTLASLNALGMKPQFSRILLIVGVGSSAAIGVVVALIASVIGVGSAFVLSRTEIPVVLPILSIVIMLATLCFFTTLVAWVAARRLQSMEWLT